MFGKKPETLEKIGVFIAEPTSNWGGASRVLLIEDANGDRILIRAVNDMQLDNQLAHVIIGDKVKVLYAARKENDFWLAGQGQSSDPDC